MNGTIAVAQREKAWHQYGCLKNFSLTHFPLSIKDKEQKTFSKAHIA
jgi:hypothetical protein